MEDILLYEMAAGGRPMPYISHVKRCGGQLEITVISDAPCVDLYLGGRLTSRQKNSGRFVFDEELPEYGRLSVKAVSRGNSTMSDEITIDL